MAKMIEVVNAAKANNHRYVELVGNDTCEMAHAIAKKFAEDRIRCRGIGAAAKRVELMNWLMAAVKKWAEMYNRSTVDFISITGIDYRTGKPYKEKFYGAFHRVNMHAYKAV